MHASGASVKISFDKQTLLEMIIDLDRVRQFAFIVTYCEPFLA